MKTKVYGFIFIIFTLFSCGSSVTREDLLPNATGPIGQIILLMDDELWNGPMGEAAMYHLDKNAKGPYARPEPMFDVWRMKPEDLNHVHQLNRMILKVMIDTDSMYKETAVLEKPNYFAKGQLFIIVKDSDFNRMYDFVVNEFAFITNKFNKFSLDIVKQEYLENPNRGIKERTEKEFGISISLPEMAQLKVDTAKFMWIKRDRAKEVMPGANSNMGAQTYWIQQGIVIWSKPYTDSIQLTVDGALRDRDTVLKYHIPGKLKGSYMATEYSEYYEPYTDVFEFKNAYTIEMRGLWKHAGNPDAFGGGPFVQYTMLHEKRQEIISVCIYIYGPQFNKRDYIREADAMLQTIEFVN